MDRIFCIVSLLFMGTVSSAQRLIDSTTALLTSPGGGYMLKFYQKKYPDGNKAMFYQVSYKQKPLIGESELDIRLDNHLSEQAMALKVDTLERWCANLRVKRITYSSKDTSWRPVLGERQQIRDHFNAVHIEMIKEDNPIYLVNLEIRAYDQGVAFRYFFPENIKGTYYRVMNENSSFSLPEGTMAWHHSWAQGPYKLVPVREWREESERPLTLELPDGRFVCLAEAQMVDYARSKFKVDTNRRNTLVTSMYTPADLISPFATPWRVIMAADRAGELIENNHLLQSLNAPSKVSDMSWIKPGKIIRVMTQTTKDAFENIDFAAKRNLQYILFDWKWYGPAFSFSSDATKVAIPDFDLPSIIAYGKKKNIGVWLYVNQQALLAQSDSLFSIYNQWGIKGVKFGFVQVGSHRWTTWIQEIFRKAAENKVMINVHDDWRPTGEQRTWPNVLTSEGIRGNEEMPDATNNTILPFTRFIAGAADYTICYYSDRIKTTHTHQLALAAIYFSPLQTLYWYDKPSMSNDEPELEFWDKIPTCWDETRILQGKPGSFISTARRKDQEWFIGTITNNEPRDIQLKLDFLPTGKKFRATIYSDDEAVSTKTKVKLERVTVTHSSLLKIKLKASGGQAIWITPADK